MTRSFGNDIINPPRERTLGEIIGDGRSRDKIFKTYGRVFGVLITLGLAASSFKSVFNAASESVIDSTSNALSRIPASDQTTPQIILKQTKS